MRTACVPHLERILAEDSGYDGVKEQQAELE